MKNEKLEHLSAGIDTFEHKLSIQKSTDFLQPRVVFL
jgi:hypothetical protein